jgi:hypothetical protein
VTHTLVLYGPSSRADALLGELARSARRGRRRLTVLALAFREPEAGCCDTRSVLWNEVCRGLAQDELARAAQVVDGERAVVLDVLACPRGRAADALVHEARVRGADEIVLADATALPLTRRDRKRLHRAGVVEPGPYS